MNLSGSAAKPSETRDFLNGLFAGKPDDLYALLWTLPEKQSYWFRSVEDAIKFGESVSEHDLYVGVGLSSKDYGPMQRCKSEEIAGIVGFWADLDLRSDAHRKTTLPASMEQALSILPSEFPPSVVVLTGNGVHIWWLFREPWIFASEDDRREAAVLVGRLHTLLLDNASQRGWTYDRLADLARVLRVPGTTNCKDPVNPKPVVIHTQSDFRYNLTEFAEYLDQMGVLNQEAESSATRGWAERFKDTILSINPLARIPDEMLNGWLEADPRFKNTWFRQRHDLPDQSQSGYDLALAHFGLSAGLADQQIVDLIAHHRSQHKEKPRTTVDYFQRTLAKARGNDGSPPGSSSIYISPLPTAFSEFDAADFRGESQSKGMICRKISDALGVTVLRMVKIAGEQPLYRMETAEGKIAFDDISKLLSPRTVRLAIAAATGKLIPPFKRNLWDDISRLMLDACILEEGSEELYQDGAARIYTRQYLSETEFIPSIENQMTQDLRRPMVRDGRITICAPDLQMHINKTTQQNLSVRSVVAMLSAIGAKAVRVRGKRIREQSRWELPVEEFDPGEYSVPDPEGGADEHE